MDDSNGEDSIKTIILVRQGQVITDQNLLVIFLPGKLCQGLAPVIPKVEDHGVQAQVLPTTTS